MVKKSIEYATCRWNLEEIDARSAQMLDCLVQATRGRWTDQMFSSAGMSHLMLGRTILMMFRSTKHTHTHRDETRSAQLHLFAHLPPSAARSSRPTSATPLCSLSDRLSDSLGTRIMKPSKARTRPAPLDVQTENWSALRAASLVLDCCDHHP